MTNIASNHSTTGPACGPLGRFGGADLLILPPLIVIIVTPPALTAVSNGLEPAEINLLCRIRSLSPLTFGGGPIQRSRSEVLKLHPLVPLPLVMVQRPYLHERLSGATTSDSSGVVPVWVVNIDRNGPHD
jgi:hypothetical protein